MTNDVPCPTAADYGRDLLADLALCDTATPGPWKWECCLPVVVRTGLPLVQMCSHLSTNPEEHTLTVNLQCRSEDADFIATARDGWPSVIRRALWAEADTERLMAAIRKHRDQCGEIERLKTALEAIWWEVSAGMDNAGPTEPHDTIRQMVDEALERTTKEGM